ncbi:MAG: DUF1499 domain-containing protein [Pseudomonadota bacterium]
MSAAVEDQSGGWRGRVALGALLFSIFAVLWFMAAALGTKFGFWSWQFGLITMMVGLGRIVVFGSLAVAVIALIVGLIRAPRKRPVMLSIAALLISGLLLGRLAGLGAGAQAVPPIHDIQTDWSDPVVFSNALMTARGGDSNPVRYGEEAVFSTEDDSPFKGRLIADIQEEAECESDDPDACEDADPPTPYRPIRPLVLSAGTAEVYAAAETLARKRGWTIVYKDEDAGVLEATETSSWFGFKDDVAIRIRPEGEGSRVDVRSTSRVGQSDLGANARRISDFLYDLDGQRY